MTESLGELSLRAKKKDATRALLARTTRKLARARGFDRITVDDIVAEAFVSRRTFFRYYESKSDAIFDGFAERLERFRSRATLGEGSAFARIRSSLLLAAGEYAEQREELITQYRIVQSSPTLIARELDLDRGWSRAFSDILRAELPPYEANVLAGAILGVVRAALAEWFESDGHADIVALGGQALDLLAKGWENRT